MRVRSSRCPIIAELKQLLKPSSRRPPRGKVATPAQPTGSDQEGSEAGSDGSEHEESDDAPESDIPEEPEQVPEFDAFFGSDDEGKHAVEADSPELLFGQMLPDGGLTPTAAGEPAGVDAFLELASTTEMSEEFLATLMADMSSESAKAMACELGLLDPSMAVSVEARWFVGYFLTFGRFDFRLPVGPLRGSLPCENLSKPCSWPPRLQRGGQELGFRLWAFRGPKREKSKNLKSKNISFEPPRRTPSTQIWCTPRTPNKQRPVKRSQNPLSRAPRSPT